MASIKTYKKGDYLTFKDEEEKQQVMRDVKRWVRVHNKVIIYGEGAMNPQKWIVVTNVSATCMLASMYMYPMMW